jgi:hypothetical protein
LTYRLQGNQNVNFNRWKDALEAFGLVAIIASLVFVGIQLRQDQVIARSELTSDSFQLMIELDQNLIDPGLASTFAKMLDRSEELTTSEMVQLDSLFGTVKGMYLRECYLKARGVLVECEQIFWETGEKYFGNWYGQSWWRLNKPQSAGDLGGLPDWIDMEIENMDANGYRRRIEEAASQD